MFSIAQKIWHFQRQLTAANKIVEGEQLLPGQRLFIPVQISKVITYTVQAEDSLYNIARQYDTLVEVLWF